MTREQLALAHHVWHCAAPDEELCAPDDSDFDFADYARRGDVMNACTHPPTGRVSTNPQGYTEGPHAATNVCDLQECIEEALAWVTRVTFGLPAFHVRDEVTQS